MKPAAATEIQEAPKWNQVHIINLNVYAKQPVKLVRYSTSLQVSVTNSSIPSDIPEPYSQGWSRVSHGSRFSWRHARTGSLLCSMNVFLKKGTNSKHQLSNGKWIEASENPSPSLKVFQLCLECEIETSLTRCVLSEFLLTETRQNNKWLLFEATNSWSSWVFFFQCRNR